MQIKVTFEAQMVARLRANEFFQEHFVKNTILIGLKTDVDYSSLRNKYYVNLMKLV